MKKICITSIFLIAMSLTQLTGVAHAQQTSLSLNPPVVEILISPNKKVVQTFNLSYIGPNLLLIPEVHLIKPSGNNGHVNIEPKPLDPATIPLIITSSKPLGEPIELTEDGGLPLTLTFEAPTTDKAIDLYLALVLRVVTADDLQTSSSASPAISSLILVSINPTGVAPIDLEINNFDLPVIQDSWHSLVFTPTLTNNTPIMIRPEGKFEVISPSGKTISTISLYPNLILGNSSRNILGLVDQTSSALNWKPGWNHIGPHRFRLTITSQGGSKLAETEKTIWILPLRLALITLIFISMIILNIYLLSRKKVTKM